MVEVSDRIFFTLFLAYPKSVSMLIRAIHGQSRKSQNFNLYESEVLNPNESKTSNPNKIEQSLYYDSMRDFLFEFRLIWVDLNWK